MFKNGNMSKIELLKEKYNEYSKLLNDVNEIINTAETNPRNIKIAWNGENRGDSVLLLSSFI